MFKCWCEKGTDLFFTRCLDHALRGGKPGARWLVIVVFDVNQTAAELELALPDTRGSTPVAKHGFGQ